MQYHRQISTLSGPIFVPKNGYCECINFKCTMIQSSNNIHCAAELTAVCTPILEGWWNGCFARSNLGLWEQRILHIWKKFSYALCCYFLYCFLLMYYRKRCCLIHLSILFFFITANFNFSFLSLSNSIAVMWLERTN